LGPQPSGCDHSRDGKPGHRVGRLPRDEPASHIFRDHQIPGPCYLTQKVTSAQMHYSAAVHSCLPNFYRYVKSRKSRYLRNGTSDHNFKIPKILCNTNYPPKPRKNHLRNHFQPLKSGFSAILRIKRIFTQTPPMDDLRRSGFCLCSYSSN